MTEPEPRTGRHAADIDFTTLPDSFSTAQTLVEQPATCPAPISEAGMVSSVAMTGGD